MNENYLKFVTWSKEDENFIGYCPDLFIGGVCHGTDESAVYHELCNMVKEEIDERYSKNCELPIARAIVAMAVPC